MSYRMTSFTVLWCIHAEQPSDALRREETIVFRKHHHARCTRFDDDDHVLSCDDVLVERATIERMFSIMDGIAQDAARNDYYDTRRNAWSWTLELRCGHTIQQKAYGTIHAPKAAAALRELIGDCFAQKGGVRPILFG